ncbi:MAG: guanosine monophosphate reductase [Chitinophagaceae bacterium]|nr:guanosine monophosphate reductase [Chitinophagaceae bacterium]MCW5905501.1 guanosine monophosphate reductase [Chitinophagaceae bacterium]
MSKLALTYDDIQLVPAFSNISSRKNIDLTTQVTKRYGLRMPLVASCMDTVCESEMAIAMAEMGGVGCVHRFMSIEQQTNEVATVVNALQDDAIKFLWNVQNTDWTFTKAIPIMAAVGANGDFAERAIALVNAGANIILIDVAHGHHENVQQAIAILKKTLPTHIDFIAGNIASAQAAKDLEAWQADGLRVGVGGGSLCTTRLKTGFGVPNVTCLQEIVAVTSLPVMADGGIRTSGDIAKALALGSSCVMLGSLIAGTKEAPGQMIEKSSGLYKRYRGAASLETKMVHNQVQRNVEGESTVIPFKGGAKFVIESLLDGVRSAFSYGGANNIKQFKPEWVQVTNAGLTEARPHLL